MAMSLVTSILTALFMVFIVFLVLILLWFILRILGVVFISKEKARIAQEAAVQPEQKV